MHEPVLVLADHHVGVDQRATAEPARDQRLEAVEGPEVEHPLEALARVPEVVLEPQRAARKRARRICLAALEDEHPSSGFGQAAGGHRAAEAGADDDDVEVGVVLFVRHWLVVTDRRGQGKS